jgi:hypothetical protein
MQTPPVAPVDPVSYPTLSETSENTPFGIGRILSMSGFFAGEFRKTHQSAVFTAN